MNISNKKFLTLLLSALLLFSSCLTAEARKNNQPKKPGFFSTVGSYLLYSYLGGNQYGFNSQVYGQNQNYNGYNNANVYGQNYGNQNYGNQNYGNQDYGNQNYGNQDQYGNSNAYVSSFSSPKNDYIPDELEDSNKDKDKEKDTYNDQNNNSQDNNYF